MSLFTAASHFILTYALMVAAATEDDDDSKNDNPSAVIVKDVAKTVIHMFLQRSFFGVLRRTLVFYEGA